MGQLQAKNPQAYQMINQAKNSGANPQALLKQMMNNMDNNQIQQVMNQAKGYGVPDSILQQMQNNK